MRVLIVRSMPSFSMDVYADGLTTGLKAVRPDWQIAEIRPVPADRHAKALSVRVQKAYERFWAFPRRVQKKAIDFDIVHIIDHSEGHIARHLNKNRVGTSQEGNRQRVVVTCHDLINYFYPGNVQGSVHLPFVSDSLWKSSVSGLKQASHVVNVSTATAKDVNRILNIPYNDMSVVYNAVEGDFHPLAQKAVINARQNLKVPENTCCLLNVGSDHPRKNIDGILSALSILHQREFPVHFWKVGSDFTKRQLEWLHTHGLLDHIKYLGNPNQQQLTEIYNAADILLAPSIHEGFGFTLLESMACGTPVITSDTSAMPEVVGDAGMLVAHNDIGAIADAVIRLHTDASHRQSMIDKGLQRAKTFTWQNAAEQVAGIYEKLLTVEDPHCKYAMK